MSLSSTGFIWSSPQGRVLLRKQNPDPPGLWVRGGSLLGKHFHLRSTKDPRSRGSWPEANRRYGSGWAQRGRSGDGALTLPGRRQTGPHAWAVKRALLWSPMAARIVGGRGARGSDFFKLFMNYRISVGKKKSTTLKQRAQWNQKVNTHPTNHTQVKNWNISRSLSCLPSVPFQSASFTPSPKVTSFFKKYLFIYLVALGLSCGIWTLRCGEWDLVPWPGIEPGPLVLGVQGLSTHGPPGQVLWLLSLLLTPKMS